MAEKIKIPRLTKTNDYDVPPRDEIFINLGIMIAKGMPTKHDICKQGQNMFDFLPCVSGFAPAPFLSLVTAIPLFDHINYKYYRWYSSLKFGEEKRYFYTFSITEESPVSDKIVSTLKNYKK